MKVIDLLNKIANGEDAPKKIQVYSDIFVLDYLNNVYEHEKTRINLLSIYNGNILNYEVGIKEEDKKIEKVNTYVLCDYDFKNKDDDNNLIATNILDKALEEYSHKINEIIDYLEEKDNE